ncbi:MAG: four helix bundle protein, partial [Geobacter sp.]|nr:four helix bundle protein [Geobacter sp.]
VQNIAEGSQASGTSKKFELKLTSVARASLEELKLDYEDFLRQRELPLWGQDDPRRKALIGRRCKTADEVAAWCKDQSEKQRQGLDGRCGLDGQKDLSISSMESIKSTIFPEVAANAALTLIAVACSLLDRQLAAQATAFEKEGGFTERLYRTRSQARRKP